MSQRSLTDPQKHKKKKTDLHFISQAWHGSPCSTSPLADAGHSTILKTLVKNMPRSNHNIVGTLPEHSVSWVTVFLGGGCPYKCSGYILEDKDSYITISVSHFLFFSYTLKSKSPINNELTVSLTVAFLTTGFNLSLGII